MTYVDGFVAAVPAENKDEYLAMAAKTAKFFLQWGATRVVENWADDVPTGKQTDFYRSVAAKEGEIIVFSWVEYPDKTTRDAAMKKMEADPEMEALQMPMDMGRMIFGGFNTIFDQGPAKA